MIYSQTSKKFISFMTGDARIRLQIRVCAARNYGKLMTLKRVKLKKKKNSTNYDEMKMSIMEDFMSNGVPRLAVETWFLMHDV